jgi:hypothetical protein
MNGTGTGLRERLERDIRRLGGMKGPVGPGKRSAVMTTSSEPRRVARGATE